MHEHRASWMAGGIGLIASGAVGVVRGSAQGAPGVEITLAVVGLVLQACSILILAVGASREDSVVGRRPLGVVALVAVAVWPLIDLPVTRLFQPASATPDSWWVAWGYLSMILPLMFGLVAASQIVRARTVPSPWSWSLFWVIAIQTALWALPELIGIASPGAYVEIGALIPALGSLGFMLGTFGLGVLAVILSVRARNRAVPVFQSTPPEDAL